MKTKVRYTKGVSDPTATGAEWVSIHAYHDGSHFVWRVYYEGERLPSRLPSDNGVAMIHIVAAQMLFDFVEVESL
ncbi:hypothetical protein A2215_01595 [Candidatus Berkelbacteria bacterium RIFOXYA2_FULL_43_10]|uniref:Uncharacterized protein n=1 Tax=Candidatus Berkelbacteria bacterium RIFOXYA2_FULL_43_10 TaxID=1797472 RepID=A0A1F5E6V5_9BACT|nr:MAG: hypothetical protein A2215_01595 [Candidatus Berkelbacteria bacterium RIFOXYA2_FULL_43_10]